MKLDRYTEKAQEAILAAQRLATDAESPVLDAEHILAALLADAEGIPAMTLRQLGADPAQVALELGAVLATARQDRRRPDSASTRAPSAFSSAPRTRPGASATSTSRPSTCCWQRPRRGRRPAHPRGGWRRPRGDPRRPPVGARQPARHVAQPGGDLPGAREVRPRPDQRRARGQARPGRRPRRGDPPRHPGAEAPDQEQPGAHRRARRRQDRHRRGPRPAHRARRRARRA